MLSLTGTIGAPFLLFPNVKIDWNISGYIIFYIRYPSLVGIIKQSVKSHWWNSLENFSYTLSVIYDIQREAPFGQPAKVCFKNLWTKFWNCCHYLTMYQIFLIQIAFWSSDWVELNFLGFVTRICLNIKSHWTKKIEVFSQGTDDSWNLKFNSWNNCHILLINVIEIPTVTLVMNNRTVT